MRLLLLIVLIVLIAIPLLLVVASDRTTLTLAPDVKVIGNETAVKVHVENPHGVRSMVAYLEQGSNRYKVYESSEPASRVFFWRKAAQPRDITFSAGKKQVAQLLDGKARVVVEAVSNDLRAATTTVAHDVEVNTKPPA